MILPLSMKFVLGELVITPAALQAVPAEEIYRGIDRHVCGDLVASVSERRQRRERICVAAWPSSFVPCMK